ncbi:MAG TPA: ATP-binding protein [Pyrinomonadaceae bacterium]|jgi:two-component system sensor histidine kinase CpxA
MKLFVKIFLWFTLATALNFIVIVFITRTFQTEPMFSRWQRSATNQLVFYGATAEQIYGVSGQAGLTQYFTRLKDNATIQDVDLLDYNGNVVFGERGGIHDFDSLVAKADAATGPAIDVNSSDAGLGIIPVNLSDGRKMVLAVRWEPPRAPSLFFDSWLGYMRLGGLVLVALLVTYMLAAYLATPIRKLRNATNRLADGDLKTRVEARLARRRDELGDLARDFDDMAGRIESLITSQQRLSRDVSHELRSPLARLNVALEIAKQKANSETQPILDRIETESQRLNDMIGRLLTLARLESGVEEIEHNKVDLSELVRDVAADADFEARANGRYVNVVETDRCTVIGTENLLRSAIENVLRNAVRYTPEGTAVDVSLTRENGHARVTVSDHGGGVPEAELLHLFEPFYRVGEARERKTGGIGLGLAIAEQAVIAHKGTISACNHDGGLQVEIQLDTAKN